MKKLVSNLLLIAVIAFGMASCTNAQKMIDAADQIDIKCNPEVLEVIAGNIDATVSVTFPPEYFLPKATLEVTPVLLYVGGEAVGKPFVYQGEKVTDNYKTVTKAGATITEKVHFDYVPGMEKSELVGRAKVYYKGAEFVYPADIKIADGANTTYMLVKRAGNVAFKKDNYQDVIVTTAEGQIKYKVNSSEVRNSELKGTSVKEFLAALDAANANERSTVKSTEIVAYASPEGAEKLNNKLSGNRSQSASKAWNKITKGHDALDPSVKSVGEDWEGFQQLVSESNIEDKELILRVLSMYSDPAVRENEIRNMSQVFTALKGEVLPELRRARLIANVETKNYTNEELLDILKNNEKILDEEALLRVASVAQDNAQKESIYQKAIERFNSSRAMYNLAALYLNEGKVSKAEAGLAELNAADPDVINAKGVVALRKDDFGTAESLFRKAGTPEAKKNLGIVLILTGQYEEAAQVLKDVDGCCHNTVLAYILTDQLDKAMESAHCGDPKVWYLKAIVAARQGKVSEMKTYLERAYKNPSLQARAAKDIEFAAYDL